MKDRMAIVKQNASLDTGRVNQSTNFNKIRVGLQTLDNAIISYGDLQRTNARLGTKSNVLKAINNGDIEEMRLISNFFYKTSGIYKRMCRYMAYLYKYDWFITPYIGECQGLLDTDSGLADTS